MKIREFRKQDAKACSELTIRCLKKVNVKDYPLNIIETMVKTFTPEFYLKKSEFNKIFVVEEDGKIIGTGRLSKDTWREWLWGGPLSSTISNIFVDVDCQGRGIGTELVKKLENEAKNIDIQRLILFSTIGAVTFYEKLGYVEQGRTDTGEFGVQIKMEKPLGD